MPAVKQIVPTNEADEDDEDTIKFIERMEYDIERMVHEIAALDKNVTVKEK